MERNKVAMFMLLVLASILPYHTLTLSLELSNRTTELDAETIVATAEASKTIVENEETMPITMEKTLYVEKQPNLNNDSQTESSVYKNITNEGEDSNMSLSTNTIPLEPSTDNMDILNKTMSKILTTIFPNLDEIFFENSSTPTSLFNPSIKTKTQEVQRNQRAQTISNAKQADTIDQLSSSLSHKTTTLTVHPEMVYFETGSFLTSTTSKITEKHFNRHKNESFDDTDYLTFSTTFSDTDKHSSPAVQDETKISDESPNSNRQNLEKKFSSYLNKETDDSIQLHNVSSSEPKNFEDTSEDSFKYKDTTDARSMETTTISFEKQENSMDFNHTSEEISSTRIAKKIVKGNGIEIARPLRPDPGYAYHPDMDLSRPYRPDTQLSQNKYFRPTPDSRGPEVKNSPLSRPEIDLHRPSFKPSFVTVYTTSSSTSSYRPSFNSPYIPQGSFGRPYSPPDFSRSTSKPSQDYMATKSSSYSDDQSRTAYDYTRLSSNTYAEKRNPISPKPYQPTWYSHDSKTSDAISNDSGSSGSVKLRSTSKPTYITRPIQQHSNKPVSIGPSVKNLTRVEFIQAKCFDNHMKVTLRFNGSFDGLVYSSGYAQDSSCSYVNGSGRHHYEFFIRLNRCGTLGQQEISDSTLYSNNMQRQNRAQYLVNTVTVQYNPIIEEDVDEHFRVTCEYGYDFWKTVTFPIVNVESASVQTRQGNPVVFTLAPPQCNMEVRSGFGPSGSRISGPVKVGDPITIVIHMKSEASGFDILVSNCYAHNGAQKRLELIDSNGCVAEEKLVSQFRGSGDRTQQVTLYSYLKAFRFTGSPALYLECDVHMCHGKCPAQRCYWRNLKKRSADMPSDSVISESVSLFQALEVRHDEVDSPLASVRSHWHDDDVVCMKTMAFGAVFACLLLLLTLAVSVSVCMCARIRRMTRYIKSPTENMYAFENFNHHALME